MIYNVYKENLRGGIVMTGNSLGVSGEPINGTGILHFIAATSPPPGGSLTDDYTRASSAGYLTIPEGGKVEFAQLVWVGTHGSGVSRLDNYNDSIGLKSPKNNNYSISGNPAYRQQITANEVKLYTNVRDITSIVTSEGSGFYTVSGVPSLLGETDESAGWQIIVVYSDNRLPFRNINVWCAFENIVGTLVGNPPQVKIFVNDFKTPTVAPVKARLVLGASGGDSYLTKDYVQFGTNPDNPATLVTLYGPNNPINNFFAGQINDDNGNLDTRGTLGNANVVPPNKLPLGTRNQWDITNIDISHALSQGQTDGYITLNTHLDTYQIAALGLQIDMNQASFTVVKSADQTIVKAGDTITYSIKFRNLGDVYANGSVFVDDLPADVTFVPGTVTLNGVNLPLADPTVGIPLGNVQPNQTVMSEVTFQARVSDNPTSTVLRNTSGINYTFLPGTGLEAHGTDYSNQVNILLDIPSRGIEFI